MFGGVHRDSRRAWPYETDFRILSVRKCAGSPRAARGIDAGIVVGSCSHLSDVTGRKQAEEGHELLAGEMSHRVKNLLAIAAGLTRHHFANDQLDARYGA